MASWPSGRNTRAIPGGLSGAGPEHAADGCGVRRGSPGQGGNRRADAYFIATCSLFSAGVPRIEG